MSDEVFALMEAADTTQKAAQALLEKSEKQTAALEKQTHALQVAISQLDAMPATLTSRLAGDINRTVKGASAEAAAALDSQVQRMKTLAAWWPTILPVAVTVILCVFLFLYTENRMKTIRELNAQIEERRQTLKKTPVMQVFSDNQGKTIYAIELKPGAQSWVQNGRTWAEMKGD